MANKILILFLATTILFSCSSSKKSSQNVGLSKGFPTSTPKPTDDGLSYSTAIVITEKTETTGVRAEYKWIGEHYSDYKVKGQALTTHDNKPFDVITITLSNGKDLDLYFDISNYFGKF